MCQIRPPRGFSGPAARIAAVVVAAMALASSAVLADAIVITKAMTASTIAEIFITKKSIRVELEIGGPDLMGFRNLMPNGVYERLGKQKGMAFVRAPNTIGYQMRYAYQYESEGKRHIILGTDRPISGFEIIHATDSRDNSVSFVTLDLDKETGKGTGIAVFGAEFKHKD